MGRSNKTPAEAVRAPGSASRGERNALMAVLLAGAVIRLGFLWLHRGAPDFANPWLDAGFHDWAARGMASGVWTLPADVPDPQLDRSPWPRPPLYPWLLAGVYKLSGGSFLAPRLLQIAVGLAAAAVAWSLTRRLWPTRPVASTVAAAFVVLNPELLYFEGELVAAAPAALVVGGVVWATARLREEASWSRAGAVGALLAFAVHLRPNLAVLGAPIGLALLWPRHHRVSPRTSALQLAFIAAMVIVTVVPIGVRNRRASGEWVTLSTNGGITLLHGNHPNADGATMSLPPHPALRAVQDVSPFAYRKMTETLSAALGTNLGFAQTDRWLRQQALDWIAANPGDFVSLSVKKALMLVGPVSVSNNKQVALEMQDNVVTRVLPGRWWLLLALAWVGALALWQTRRQRDPGLGLLVASSLVITLAALVPFVAAARFRVPLVPLLAVLAGGGVAACLDAVRGRRSVDDTLGAKTGPATTSGDPEAGPGRGMLRLTPFGALALGLLLFAPNWTGYQPDAAQWHLDRARAHLRGGDRASAQKEAEAALQLQTTHPEALVTLGFIHATGGNLPVARRFFRRALRAMPHHLQAKAQLGATLYGLGQADAAEPLLQEVVRAVPTDVNARFNYALTLAALGRTEQARAELKTVLQQQPKWVPAQRALERLP